MADSQPSPGADLRARPVFDAICGYAPLDLDAERLKSYAAIWTNVALAAADAVDPLRAAVRAFLDHWDAFVGDDDIVVLRVTAVAELRAALAGEQ